MNRFLFSSLFHVGERISSGNPDNPRSSAFLNVLATEDDGFRYKSVKSESKGRFTYAYIDVVVAGFEKIDPLSIQTTIQSVFLAAGLRKNVSTENYAYGFAREIRLRMAKPFLYAGELLDKPPNLTESEEAGKTFQEGTLSRVLVDRQERSPRARAACILEHGLVCKACGFNLESVYGTIGRLYPCASR